MASPVESHTGSFANGVRRFSRLLPAHVKADPDVLTMVPNSGLARTFDHGRGVSRSESSTTTYSRPSSEKPPSPFSIRSLGAVSGEADGAGRRISASTGTAWPG